MSYHRVRRITGVFMIAFMVAFLGIHLYGEMVSNQTLYLLVVEIIWPFVKALLIIAFVALWLFTGVKLATEKPDTE